MQGPQSRRSVLMQLGALGGASTLIVPAWAQSFPAKPIRLVVPYPPGGSTDILARAFVEPFARHLGQTIVIENRPGAATNIGLELVARSPADGYTVYFGTSSLASNPHFGPVPSVDVFKDITPVSLLATMPYLVAANPGFPANTPRELLDLARPQPGKFTISSASLATQVKTLNKRAGMDLLHVPYKGGAQASADAIAGHVNLVIALLPVLLPHVKSGKLKPIGISFDQRSRAAPNIPTFQEIGVQGPAPSWFALYAPAGTPAAVVSRLNAATVVAAQDANLIKQTLDKGIDVRSSTPAELDALLKDHYKQNAVLVKEVG